ncbi:MAG TPA: hypothetical protein VI564_04070 [Candidatus Nanoarchaeia archaeon]|nr:hypothetical protein [Candidatus Nanoarchaeia archaeon]
MEFYSVENAQLTVESFVDKYSVFRKKKDFTQGAYNYLLDDADDIWFLDDYIEDHYGTNGYYFALFTGSFMGNFKKYLWGIKRQDRLEASMGRLEEKIHLIGLGSRLY